jgi:hypothetical protein
MAHYWDKGRISLRLNRSAVMAAFVTAIHVFLGSRLSAARPWMAGTSPAMTPQENSST